MPTASKFSANLRETHAALLDAMRRLEGLANAPTSTSGEQLSNRLGELRADVAKHFVLEEQNGYLNPALGIGRTTQWKTRELLREHNSLLRSLDRIIQQSAKEGRQSTRLWENIRQWLDRVRRHEVREAELFQEAGDEDLCRRD